jgi:hypothetical protein
MTNEQSMMNNERASKVPPFRVSAIRPPSIGHSSLISDVESHSRNVFGSGIGPENA